MTSDRFDTIEDDFKELYELIKWKVEGRLPSALGEEGKRLVREIDRSHEEATNMIRNMEAEIQKAPAYERSSLRSRLASNKRSLDNVMARMQHLSRQNNDLDDVESLQRSRLMQGTRSLQRASESVQRSRQIAAETDEIGVNIISELDDQGNALERTRDSLKNTQGALNKSRIIVKTMGIRVITNKLIMLVIILAELGILAGVVYIKFFKPK